MNRKLATNRYGGRSVAKIGQILVTMAIVSESLSSIWKFFEPQCHFLFYCVNFHCIKWPNIEVTI